MRKINYSVNACVENMWIYAYAGYKSVTPIPMGEYESIHKSLWRYISRVYSRFCLFTYTTFLRRWLNFTNGPSQIYYIKLYGFAIWLPYSDRPYFIPNWNASLRYSYYISSSRLLKWRSRTTASWNWMEQKLTYIEVEQVDKDPRHASDQNRGRVLNTRLNIVYSICVSDLI